MHKKQHVGQRDINTKFVNHESFQRRKTDLTWNLLYNYFSSFSDEFDVSESSIFWNCDSVAVA
jgi:hypothetical protein